MKLISFTFLFFIGLFILSCGSDLKNRSSQEMLSAYLNGNKEAIIFGKVDIKSILEKADYKNIPKLSVLLISEMKQYESALDLSEGVNFAIEGSIEQNNPKGTFIAFAKVKNVDSLASKVSSLGYMLKDVSGIKFFQENEVAIGIKDQLAVFMTKQGKYDGKKELLAVFEKCEREVSSGKVAEILSQKGDILTGFNFENLYNSSSSLMVDVDNKKMKEINALMVDSYLYSTIDFEKGQAVIKANNLLSTQLMNRMVMKSDPSAAILKKLGKGKARFGLAMNVDMVKYDHFINDLYPNLKSELTKLNFQLQIAMSTLGENPFSALMNGQLGFVMVGDAIKDGSFVPEFNFHLGLGNKGKVVSEMLSAFTTTLEKNGDGSFSMNGVNIILNDKEITAYSSKNTTTSSKLEVPEFASGFGKKGLTGFLNLDGLDMKSMDLEEGAKAILAIKSIYFEGTNETFVMTIKAKKSDVNILKQIADVYLDDIKQKLGALN